MQLLTFFKGGEEEEAEFAIGAPQGFKHESHIGWTPDGGFDVRTTLTTRTTRHMSHVA